MMKKMLTLVLVLALSGVTFAGQMILDVEVGGIDYTGQALAVGTEVAVKLVQLSADTAGSGGELTVNFDGANGTLMQDMLVAPTYNPGPPATLAGWSWSFDGGTAVYDSPITFAWVGKAAVAGTGTPGLGVDLDQIGTLMYEYTLGFTFNATQSTLVQVGGLWDSVDLASLSEQVNVIPEPMTMALLGLGGLFLRRKK